MYSLNSDVKRISNSVFISNSAYNSGGSVYIDKNTSDVQMVACSFTDSFSAFAG